MILITFGGTVRLGHDQSLTEGISKMSHVTQDQQNKVKQQWEQIRAEISRRWPEITQQELEMVGGDSRKLVSLIHQKTGDGLEEIEEAIDEIASESNGLMSRLADSAHEIVDTASSYARAKAQQIAQPVGHAYESAEHAVAERPMSSVAIAFGVGFVAGMCLTSFLSRPSSPPPAWYSADRLPSWKSAKDHLPWTS